MANTLYPGMPFSPQATLTNNIGEADTIIQVSDVSAFPPAPNLATIGTDEEGETILYAAKTDTALSGCQRGIEGTARAWTAGELIGRNFTAKDHADLIAAVLGIKTAYEQAVDGGYTGTEIEFKHILADAATKKYVDDTVKSGSVKKHIFTVSGPIAADETFILSFSGFDSNPYNGSTIFFGIPINYPMFPSTPLLPERAFQFEVISGWGSGTFTPAGWGSAGGTYNGTLTAKALTELPEGTPAKILWVWI